MIVLFEKLDDKREVMNNTRKLKGLVNEQEKLFFIRHYLPPGRKEMQICENDILKENENVAVIDQQEMTKKNNKLYVDNEPYKKKVTILMVQAILGTPKEEFNEIMDLDIRESDKKTVEGGYFQGFSICTDNWEEIQKAYITRKPFGFMQSCFFCRGMKKMLYFFEY